MADYLDGHGVTHLFLTTQVGRQFVLYARPRYLRYLSVGGEKLVTLDPPEGYEFLNVYGPTETTIYLTEPYGNRGWGRCQRGGLTEIEVGALNLTEIEVVACHKFLFR